MIEEKIGTFILKDSPVVINKDQRTCEIEVTNTGNRMIQIGSHFHFFEVNKELEFDREKAFGMHLDIPSGTAIRFGAGKTAKVQLVEYRGRQRITGFNGLTNGFVKDPGVKKEALAKARLLGYIKENPDE